MKVAISGAGRVSRRHIIETLEKVAERDATLIIAVPADLDSGSSSAAVYAADWAADHDIDYEIAVPAKETLSEYVTQLLEASTQRHYTRTVARLLETGDELYLAWTDDETNMRNLISASKKGVDVYDLTSKNDTIVLAGPDEEEEDEDIEFERGTPMVGGDRDDLDVYIDHRDVMKKVQRILDRAMGDVQSILSEHIETSAAPRKNRRSNRTNA